MFFLVHSTQQQWLKWLVEQEGEGVTVLLEASVNSNICMVLFFVEKSFVYVYEYG